MTKPTDRPTIMRSFLGRMRGLGAGHNVFEHWWAERLCAIGMTPLSIWFIIQIVRLGDADHKEVVKWVGKPVNTSLLLALMLLTFNHMQLGLRVISEDYSRGKYRMALGLLIRGGTLLMGLFAVLSVLKLAFAPSSIKE
ncbi:MAG: succinate dehydrogenase, hydrophobic membrane anchor protein [Commensalibacter sp.]